MTGWAEDKIDLGQYNELLRSVVAVKTKPSFPNPRDKYEPTDPNLWKIVLEVASGKRLEYRRGERTIHSPNGTRGYRNMPNNPNGIAWAVKQYNGFNGNWKEREASVKVARYDHWDQRLVRMAHGGVEVTEGSDTTGAQERASLGLLRLASVQGDRHYWDITEKGLRMVVASLQNELERRLREVKQRADTYPDTGGQLEDNNLLSDGDKEMLRDFAAWYRKNFRVDSAKTPKGQKRTKEDGMRLLRALDTYSTPGGRTSPRVLNSIYEIGSQLEIKDLVAYFTEEGDSSRGTEEKLTELKGSHATYFNRGNISNTNFKKYVARLDQILASLKGWRKKATAGSLKVVFVGRQHMTVQGKYKESADELWVKATPQVMKRGSGGYASPEYIIVHELGHRYERYNRVPQDFDKSQWWTSRYSHKEGEAFAELFAISNFKLTGPWNNDVVEKFERVMTGKEKVAALPEVSKPFQSTTRVPKNWAD